MQVKLVGGPDDGHVQAVTLAALSDGLEGTAGAICRRNQELDTVDGYRFFEYQQP